MTQPLGAGGARARWEMTRPGLGHDYEIGSRRKPWRGQWEKSLRSPRRIKGAITPLYLDLKRAASGPGPAATRFKRRPSPPPCRPCGRRICFSSRYARDIRNYERQPARIRFRKRLLKGLSTRVWSARMAASGFRVCGLPLDAKVAMGPPVHCPPEIRSNSL